MREISGQLAHNPSSADIFARRRISWFIIAGLLGALALVSMHVVRDPHITCGSPMLSALEIVENVILPRTNLEFDQIRIHRGCTYEIYTVMLDVLISLLCTAGTILSLQDAKRFPPDSFQRPTNITLMTTKEFSVSCLIYFVGVVFDPPTFGHPSFYQNYVDATGIYFIKEGTLIVVGYYNLSKIIINVFLSLFRVNRIFLP